MSENKPEKDKKLSFYEFVTICYMVFAALACICCMILLAVLSYSWAYVITYSIKDMGNLILVLAFFFIAIVFGIIVFFASIALARGSKFAVVRKISKITKIVSICGIPACIICVFAIPYIIRLF